jgi:phage protein U
MYGQLGDIIFDGLYGPETFERKDSISVPLHQRIGRRPKIQFTGIDLGQIRIGIHLHRGFINVEEAIFKFREYRNTVKHLRYITGSGNVIGTFIITDTRQINIQETPQGDIVSARLELSLLETNASQPKVVAVNNAVANRANNPAIVPLVPIVPSLPVSAALDVSIARSEANISSELIGYSTYDGPPAESRFQQAKKRIINAREKMADAAAKVQAAAETAQQAQNYVANMYTAIQNANVVEQYINAFDPNDPIGSINNVVNANGQFMASVSVMTNTSQPLAAFTGARKWR